MVSQGLLVPISSAYMDPGQVTSLLLGPCLFYALLVIKLQ